MLIPICLSQLLGSYSLPYFLLSHGGALEDRDGAWLQYHCSHLHWFAFNRKQALRVQYLEARPSFTFSLAHGHVVLASAPAIHKLLSEVNMKFLLPVLVNFPVL